MPPTPPTLDVSDLPGLLAPGLKVYVPGTSGEPTAFLEALHEQPWHARGVHFISNAVPGINAFNPLPLDDACSYSCFFMQPVLEEYASSPRLDYVPLSYFGIDRYLRSVAPPDLAVVQVSPPDRNGVCSLGTCVDFNLTVLSVAGRRVAVINDRMPRLSGSVNVPLSIFESVASCDQALAQPRSPPSHDSIGSTIASKVASLVEDGDTVQFGIGSLPSQVIAALRSHRRLRVHSGIVADGIQCLLDCGALDERQPVVCASLAAGPEFLRRLATGAGWLTVKPVSYTHHPATLAATERLVAINTGLEVDLLGQVNAELAGKRRISGPGGLPDFATAAHHSPCGRSIIALPSTNSTGRASRIVARLTAGAPATLARTCVDYVVTEYGIARLRGRNERERERALIEVAHPDFRAALADAHG